MPSIHDAASDASESGQDWYVRLSGVRLVALFIATVAAALSISLGQFDATGAVLIAAFASAAVAEFILAIFQPERDWYAGRAIAESAKTLAWRFAVQGEPFGPSLSETDASTLLRKRLTEVLERGKDRMNLSHLDAIFTPSMRTLRQAEFPARQAAYIEHRTEEQQDWYSRNARYNASRATLWRSALIVGEIVALIIGALSYGRKEPFDFAGLVAAVVAGGAAWLALKQHSQLASAYRIASTELTLQASLLRDVTEHEWPQAVADAEEAVSREHTMWLASRGEEPLPKSH